MNHLLRLNDYELEALRQALDISLHTVKNADDYPIILDPITITGPDYTVLFTDENLKDLTAIIAKVNCL